MSRQRRNCDRRCAIAFALTLFLCLHRARCLPGIVSLARGKQRVVTIRRGLDTAPASVGREATGETIVITDWRGIVHRCDLGASELENAEPSSKKKVYEAWALVEEEAQDSCVKTDLGWFTLELCYRKTIRQFHEV
jgi:hypothetical protein